jgi:type IV secretory pathway TrbD component
VTALVVIAAALASTALGVGLLSWQARLALGMWLVHQQRLQQPPPAAPPAPDEVLKRLDALELKVAQHDVARLAGRR